MSKADSSAGPGTVNAAKRLKRVGARVHCLGICGIGMAGLAALLQRRGFSVDGCDAVPNALADWLVAAGIPVRQGHDVSHIDAGPEWAVRSAAVSPAAAEVRACTTRGIPVFTRGEVLAALSAETRLVAVSGTHGKTTTATFTAAILREAGLAPSWCIGGESSLLPGVSGGEAGAGDWMVVEADESDGSVALYRSAIAVVTNIEFDHMEHFRDIETFESCFRAFVSAASEAVVYASADARSRRVCSPHRHAVSFGLDADADCRAESIDDAKNGVTFRWFYRDEDLGSVQLPVTGRHNVLNALAAAAAAREAGVHADTIRVALAGVALPRRRFETIAVTGGIEVISDYAHHPTEVRAVMGMAAERGMRRTVAVFQPHRYTRTAALCRDFPPAFSGCERLVLTPVYPASEKPLQGGTVWDLYKAFRAVSGSDPLPVPVVADSLEHAWRYLRHELRHGDLFLVIGAGDVERLATRARDELCGSNRDGIVCGSAVTLPPGKGRGGHWRHAFRDPLGPRTTYGVGGAAELWIEVLSTEGLEDVLGWASRADIPWRVLGAGSNVLVSDLGVEGLVLRLAGPAFRTIEERDECVVAAASVGLGRLSAWAEENGWTGLEFLEGIPGTVGGAVRMNAGAAGYTCCERIRWIRCLNSEGRNIILNQENLEAGYRRCRAVRNLVVVEAAFELKRDAPSRVAERRCEARARRIDWSGRRTGGSVFKNPPGSKAGRLLERAGMKGMRVGGAVVSEDHANVIVAEGSSTASDVLALLKTMQDAVSAFGMDLEPEICLWK